MRSFTVIIALILVVCLLEAYAQGNSLPEKAATSSIAFMQDTNQMLGVYSHDGLTQDAFYSVIPGLISSGIIAGITIFALVCSVLLIVGFKKRFYGYLLLYALSFLLAVVIENVYMMQGNDRSGWSILAALRIVCITLMPLASLLFLRRFWKTRLIAKRFDNFLQILAVLYCFVLVFAVSGNGEVWESRIMPILSVVGELGLLFLCWRLWKNRATIERFSPIEMAATAMFLLVLPGEGFVRSMFALLSLQVSGDTFSSAVSSSTAGLVPVPLSSVVFSVLTCIQLVLFPCGFFLRIRDDNKRFAIAAQERLVVEQQALAENRRNDALRRANAEILGQQELLEKQRRQIEGMNVALHENNRQLSTQNLLLKELHTEKDEFLGIVAHDLKNPLAAIASFANILRHDDGSLSPRQQSEFVGHIIESAERMFVIIRNLLDINALERGGLRAHLQPIEISSILDYAVSSYRERAAEKHITLRTDFAPVPFALGDESLVMQVVDNLLSNALKYSPHGTTVTVKIKTVSTQMADTQTTDTQITDTQATDTHTIGVKNSSVLPFAPLPSTFATLASSVVRFEVHDQGPGLTEEDKDKLFGKFARLSAQPTGGEHSTGLGLSIVKKMVEVMNGHVFCESRFGEGSAFIVELPVADYEQ